MFLSFSKTGDNEARARLHAAGSINRDCVHTFYNLLCRTNRLLNNDGISQNNVSYSVYTLSESFKLEGIHLHFDIIAFM